MDLITIESLRDAPVQPNTKFHIVESLRAGRPLDGHICEFGVWSGCSITWIANDVTVYPVHGFDSFEGLPLPWDRGPDIRPAGHFHTHGKRPYVPPNVKLHVGWFTDTLPTWLDQHPGPMRFLNIDSDIYQSALDVLTLCNDRIQPGTVIRFDEIGSWCTPHPINGSLYTTWAEHEIKALNEWLHEYDRQVYPLSRDGEYGASVMVR